MGCFHIRNSIRRHVRVCLLRRTHLSTNGRTEGYKGRKGEGRGCDGLSLLSMRRSHSACALFLLYFCWIMYSYGRVCSYGLSVTPQPPLPLPVPKFVAEGPSNRRGHQPRRPLSNLTEGVNAAGDADTSAFAIRRLTQCIATILKDWPANDHLARSYWFLANRNSQAFR